MALSLIKDSGAKAVFIMCLVTGPLCSIAAILRFVATKRIGRQQSAEDWFAYAAVVIHLIYIAMCLDALARINGRPILELSGGEFLYIMKLYYAVPPLFILNQVFSKTSILLFYHRVFGIVRIWNRWIYGIGVMTLLWAIGVLPLFLFSCRPIRRGWDPLEPGVCLSYPATVAGAETINSGIDFMMVVLAWLMVRPLHVSTATKLKLGVILAVAGLAGIIGLVKIGQTYTSSEQAIRYNTGLWAIIQMACSIICCCAPTYKPILPSNDFLKRYIMPGSRSRYSKSAPSGATLTGYESRAENKRQSIPRHWMKMIEGGGPSVTVWAEVQPHRGQPSLEEGGDLAMNNTIQVHRTVDVVY